MATLNISIARLGQPDRSWPSGLGALGWGAATDDSRSGYPARSLKT